MLDLAQLADSYRPDEYPIGGQSLRVRLATVGQVAELQRWLDRQTPEPPPGVGAEDQARKGDIPPAHLRALAEGQAAARMLYLAPEVTTAEGMRRLYRAPGGVAELLRVMLAPEHPEVTPEFAAKLADILPRATIDMMTVSFFPNDPLDAREAYAPLLLRASALHARTTGAEVPSGSGPADGSPTPDADGPDATSPTPTPGPPSSGPEPASPEPTTATT